MISFGERICQGESVSGSVKHREREHQCKIDTLLVHCYAGQSRSCTVGALAVKMLVGDNSRYFKGAIPNQYVYDVLEAVWIRYMLQNNGW